MNMVTTQKLIVELNCLKDIVGDFLSHQFNRLDIFQEKGTAPKSKHSDFKNDMSVHMDPLEDINGKNSECSSQVVEIVDAVKVSLLSPSTYDLN